MPVSVPLSSPVLNTRCYFLKQVYHAGGKDVGWRYIHIPPCPLLSSGFSLDTLLDRLYSSVSCLFVFLLWMLNHSAHLVFSSCKILRRWFKLASLCGRDLILVVIILSLLLIVTTITRREMETSFFN